MTLRSMTTSEYVQVKNPFPIFIVPCQKGTERPKRTLPFNKMLMQKAINFTQTWNFTLLVTLSRAKGTRQRRPPLLRCRAIDALIQAICFHYDPLANRVNATMTTLASECGLATETKSGKLSISRATRALQYLAEELGIITYQTEFDPELGCYLPTNITFTGLFFESIQVSEDTVSAARKSRAEYKNMQRSQKGKPRLTLDKLISLAWTAFRERFKAYRLMRKAYGEKRARARREANLSYREISSLVRKELTREIAAGECRLNFQDVGNEIKRRVKQRMIMSRTGTYQLTVQSC
ncbi:incFII family plasmid replication initiator RepA [Enterobacter bugandensis]|nr:incFII family plasmid replication initiator RepA [Enterobacter bugandensis]